MLFWALGDRPLLHDCKSLHRWYDDRVNVIWQQALLHAMSGHWKVQTIKHEWVWPKFSLNDRTIVEDTGNEGDTSSQRSTKWMCEGLNHAFQRVCVSQQDWDLPDGGGKNIHDTRAIQMYCSRHSQRRQLEGLWLPKDWELAIQSHRPWAWQEILENRAELDVDLRELQSTTHTSGEWRSTAAGKTNSGQWQRLLTGGTTDQHSLCPPRPQSRSG